MGDKTYDTGWKSKTDINMAQFIKKLLDDEGPCFVQEMYREWKAYLESRDIKYWGTRDSFGTYINILKKLNLIEVSHQGEAPFEGAEKRNYYKIVEENKDSDAWNRPQEVYNPETTYGGEIYKTRKEKAEKLGITVRELALRDKPELREIRETLGIED